MKTIRANDLDTMCAKNQKIWVQNTSKSILLINVPGGQFLRMPVSDEPICLNSYYSTEIIKQATDLRRMICAGVIKLLSPRSKEVRGKAGTLPLNKAIDISKPVNPDPVGETSVPRATPVSMELSASQMRILANHFMAIAKEEMEVVYIPGAFLVPKEKMDVSFPISVYDEWYMLADRAFEDTYLVGHGCLALAEVAASMLLTEAELKEQAVA
jgi:hypothetical protein